MTSLPLFNRYDRRPFGGNYDEADEPKMRSIQESTDALFFAHPGVWFTVSEIRNGIGVPAETEITARCRSLRSRLENENSVWTVECERIDGHYAYRLAIRAPKGAK